MSKKRAGFNSPFEKLKGLKIEPPPKPKAPEPPPKKTIEAPTDERAFEDEMQGVMRLEPDPRGRLGGPPPSPPKPLRGREREEAEAYAQLADLVAGAGAFDISDTDEFIEGIAPGMDRRILKKLRKGDYAMEGHLDLHGLVSEEARVEVERFLDEARKQGKRCVLLIHGRGLNSKEGIPVLKERLQVWLTRGRIAKGVLAFSTARPCDGGAGAVYVLLRK